jgi:hypothetical protein
VVPKGMAIRFPFDQNHDPLVLGLAEAVKSVEARFSSRFPAEPISVESDPKSDGQLFAIHPEVWNANGRLMIVGELRQPAGLQELDRQHLGGRVLVQSEANRAGIVRGS